MSKPKNRLGGKTVPKSGKPRLQLKGRIFIQNITDICKHEETRMPTKSELIPLHFSCKDID